VECGDATNPCVTLTFNNIPTERQGLFHTQTTCANFVTGTGAPIVDGDIRYGLKSNGTINNVSPGVFFFYATYSHGGGVLDVDLHEFRNNDQSATTPGSTTSTDFVVQNGQAFLYRVSGSTCTTVSAVTKTFTPSSTLGPDVKIVTNASVAAGTYVLGVKYTPSSTLTGSLPCGGGAGNDGICRYWFVPSLGTTQLDARAVNFLFQKK